VIGKRIRKLLIDTNAKAGDKTQEIDGYAIDHEDGSVDFGKLIRCTKTGELEHNHICLRQGGYAFISVS